jgi:hypothetical protein
MLTRWGIRLGTSLVGIAAGLALSAAISGSPQRSPTQLSDTFGARMIKDRRRD